MSRKAARVYTCSIPSHVSRVPFLAAGSVLPPTVFDCVRVTGRSGRRVRQDEEGEVHICTGRVQPDVSCFVFSCITCIEQIQPEAGYWRETWRLMAGSHSKKRHPPPSHGPPQKTGEPGREGARAGDPSKTSPPRVRRPPPCPVSLACPLAAESQLGCLLGAGRGWAGLGWLGWAGWLAQPSDPIG